MTKVSTQEIEELFNIPAINVDKGYITLKGTAEKGSVRITFVEGVAGSDKIKARAAINIAHEGMVDLGQAIAQVMQMLQPPKQDIVENTEQPKDDTPVLQ